MSVPLKLKGIMDWRGSVDPDDVMVTKRSLNRLGYYPTPDWGLTPYPTEAMFRSLSAFQKQENLIPDRIMKPDGPTATRLGQVLTDLSPEIDSEPVFTTLASVTKKPSPEQCDHMYWNVDIPTCRAIQARRGKRAAARCYHTATARYAACLRGTPVSELPPLDIWNQ